MERSNNYDPMLELGDIIFEKYAVLSEYTTGGMNSKIFLGKNLTMSDNKLSEWENKNVIIKIVKRSPDMKDYNWIKFCEELTTTTRVSHPNLVQTYDVAQPTLQVRKKNGHTKIINNVAVIVMEFVNGPSLRGLMNQNGYISIEEAMYYFQKIVAGVNKLHTYSHMIIHRDLKPENILLSKDLRDVKIVDFGISSSIIEDEKLILTNEKALFGTVDYMAPDNLDDEIDKDGNRHRILPTPQFDFYSLGVILFEMITGEKPFSKDPKDDKKTIKKAKIYDVPIMKSIRFDVPNSIENIVFRCIASKQEDLQFRYSKCSELLKDVENYNQKNRIDEPLLKEMNKRIFERKIMFNTLVEKDKEKKYMSKWFFWTITFTMLFIILLAVVSLSLILKKG